jgi:hypothetical protein
MTQIRLAACIYAQCMLGKMNTRVDATATYVDAADNSPSKSQQTNCDINSNVMAVFWPMRNMS